MQTYKGPRNTKYKILNSPAVVMAVARPYGFEIDFVRNPFSGLAVWFFVITLKFISTLIFSTKIKERKFVDTKKKFLKADFPWMTIN